MARDSRIVRLSSKGQLVIPAPVRKRLGLKTGQALAVRTGRQGEIVLRPAEAGAESVEAMLRRARSWAAGKNRDLVRELHDRRRREAKREAEGR